LLEEADPPKGKRPAGASTYATNGWIVTGATAHKNAIASGRDGARRRHCEERRGGGVIARSEATKPSSGYGLLKDWIASRSLAMMVWTAPP